MTTYYQNIGPVRGACGHKHRGINYGLSDCYQADHSRCRKQGGYSDRQPMAVEDGTLRPLNDAEWGEWERIVPFP